MMKSEYCTYYHDETQVVCAVTTNPADLFIRNGQGRLVPLFRPLYEGILANKESLLPILRDVGKEEMVEFMEGSDFEEFSLEEFSSEYWDQDPNEKEALRRKTGLLFKDLVVTKIVWSSKEAITEDDVAKAIPKDADIPSLKISRIQDYPSAGFIFVAVTNKELDESEMKILVDHTKIS